MGMKQKIKMTDSIFELVDEIGKSIYNNLLAESHFGQNDTLARDTLARMTLWPE